MKGTPKGNPAANNRGGLQNTAAAALGRNLPAHNGNNTPLSGRPVVGNGVNPNTGKTKTPG